MKKLIFLSLIVLLCLPLSVYAASIGGAETSGQGKFAIGIDQEFVFDKDLKTKTANYQWTILPDILVNDNWKLESEINKISRTMAKVSYGILSNLDVYLKLGTADFKSTHNYISTWSTESNSGIWNEGNVKIEGENAFAYGFGMKGTYPLKNDWFVGCDAQYLRHKNDLKGTDSGISYGYWVPSMERASSEFYSESFEGNVVFQEWQIAPYIAKKLGNFIPYLGIKYSDQKMIYKDKYGKTNFKADDNFGMFFGTDYKIAENWKINLEGRFIDETAMSLTATYRF